MDKKDMSKMGDELIKMLPNDIKDAMAKVMSMYTGDIFFEKVIVEYPALLNREMFLRTISKFIVSIIRTHTTNKNVEDQQNLMVDFLKELENQSNKMAYYSDVFGDNPEVQRIVKQKREQFFKNRIKRDLDE